MSLLFPDRILIGLAPDSIALVRLQGALRPRASEKRTLACDPAPGTEPWRGALAALSGLAAEIGNDNARITVVLSNHFVRYALVPVSEALSSGAEEDAFVRYYFAKIHGERSKEWEVRLSRGPAGTARVASAVDSALVQAIRGAFPAGGKAKLVSLQPYLMSAFNRWRALFAGVRGWLLLVEPRRTCLARFDRGRVDAVRNTRGVFEDPARWAELFDRERLLAGPAETPEGVYVHAPRASKEAHEVRGWTFRGLSLAPLEGLAPAEADAFAMALCAQ